VKQSGAAGLQSTTRGVADRRIRALFPSAQPYSARGADTEGPRASAIPDVRESDTRPREVYCAGCGRGLQVALSPSEAVVAYERADSKRRIAKGAMP
jgi:hypothetical protein